MKLEFCVHTLFHRLSNKFFIMFLNYSSNETVYLLPQQGSTGPIGNEGIIGPRGRTVSLSQYGFFFFFIFFFSLTLFLVNLKKYYSLIREAKGQTKSYFLLEGDFWKVRGLIHNKDIHSERSTYNWSWERKIELKQGSRDWAWKV